jgi:hypothetical protein
MGGIVVGELSQREKVDPVVLTLRRVEAEELFQVLVDPFSLSVSLRMVGSGEFWLDSQSFVKGTKGGCGELGTTIRDGVLREAVMFPDMREEEVSNAECINCFGCGDEMSHLCETVHNVEDGVEALYRGKSRDQVVRDRCPRSCGNLERLERSVRTLGEVLGTVALIAAVHISIDVGLEGWPSISARYKL